MPLVTSGTGYFTFAVERSISSAAGNGGKG
jgi:hypothetical protein